MKKFFFFIALLLSLNTFANNGDDKPTKDTVINHVSYKLYVGSKGGRYIIVTSKTGKEYKKYFSR